MQRMEVFTTDVPAAKPFVADFMERWDRCSVLKEWCANDVAFAIEVATALFRWWKINTYMQVKWVETTSPEGRVLAAKAKELRAMEARLQKLGSASAAAVKQEADDVDARIFAPSRNSVMRSLRVAWIDLAVRIHVRNLGTNERHRRLAAFFTEWDAEPWSPARVRVVVLRTHAAAHRTALRSGATDDPAPEFIDLCVSLWS